MSWPHLPLEDEEMKRRLTKAAPVSWPIRVTRDGSPPKAAMLVLIQRRAKLMSFIPKFELSLSSLLGSPLFCPLATGVFGLVLKKPGATKN